MHPALKHRFLIAFRHSSTYFHCVARKGLICIGIRSLVQFPDMLLRHPLRLPQITRECVRMQSP